MTRDQWIIAAVVVIVAVAAAATIVAFDGRDDGRETLVVETNFDSAPFDYEVGDDMAGIDMDLVRAICDDMGYDVEVKTNTFDKIIDSVMNGGSDIGANAFSVNDEREELVLFSDSYVTVHKVVVVPVGSDIRTPDDLRGRTISVVSGTTYADCAETFSDSIVYREEYTSSLNDVLSGDADCEIVDNYIAQSQMSDYPKRIAVLDLDLGFGSEDFGFIFSKDNAELRDRFNESFANIVENGVYDDIMDYYSQNGFASDTGSYYDEDRFTVGSFPNLAPFNYYYDGNVLSGIDSDIVRALCEQMGTHCLTETYDTFGDLMQSIGNGEFDMGASGITITDERKESYLFSDPYLEVRQVLVTGLSENYKLSDLRDLTIATEAGTTSKDIAEEYGGTVLEFPSYEAAMQAVLDGRADCEVTDSFVAQSQVSNNRGLKTLDILGSPEQFAFIFSKDDRALCDRVNAALGEIRANGVLDRILDYYHIQDYKPVEPYFGSSDVITIGTLSGSAPFSYYLDGRLSGVDLDMAKAMGDIMGVGINIVETDFGDMFDKVISGEFDIGASGITITDERKDLVLFSDPYATVRQVLVVKNDAYYTPDDLKDLTIASQSYTTSMDIAGQYSDKLLGFLTYEEAAAAVLEGKADCCVMDNFSGQAIVSANPEMKMLDILDNIEEFAFIFSKNNPELRDRVNDALKEMETNGSYNEILRYYDNRDYMEVESYYDSDDVISIGTFPELPPFDYDHDGKLAGIDLDILRAVGYRINASFYIGETETFDGVMEGVMNGVYDIGSSGITITEDRAEKFLFSEPYMEVRHVIVMKDGADIDVGDLRDVRVATHYNTTSMDIAKKYSDNVMVFQSYDEALQAVLDGRADCEMTVDFTAMAQMAQNPGVEFREIPGEKESFAFVFSKDNQELCDRVNAALEILKGEGRIDKILDYYAESEYRDVESYFDSDKVIKVSYYPKLPPFNYTYEGMPAGIDMDMLWSVEERMDKVFLIEQSATFEYVFKSVANGNADMGAAGVTINDERQQDYLFSDPYIEVKQVIVVKADAPNYTKSDLKNLSLASHWSTTGMDVAKKYSDDVRGFGSYEQAIQAVLNGGVDAEVLDDIAAQTLLTKYSGLKVLDILDEKESFAFMFSKNDTELRDLVNTALEESAADGMMGKILDYYKSNDYREVISYYLSDEYLGSQ